MLTSLCAEGTPVLTLEMCRRWMAVGISPVVVTLAGRPNDLEAEFRAAGVPLETIELPRTGPRRFLQLAISMYILCRRLRPRAVLSMPLGWHTFMFMGARAAGVKITAAHVGNYPPMHARSALAKFRWLVQLGRPLTSTLICCSSYIQTGTIEHFGVTLPETSVIYNGVDVEEIARRAAIHRRSDRQGRPFVVGMVATLEVHKDQPTLIQAMALLRDRAVPVELWLLGEGARRGEYEELIARLGLADRVKLLGMRRDVPELLGQMDAFAFSAKRDEGLGVALIEAMAAGLPIVATDVGACREVLKNGELAQLVPEADVTAFANAIEALVQGRVDAKTSIDACRKRATEVFSIDEMATRYARCLNLRSLPVAT